MAAAKEHLSSLSHAFVTTVIFALLLSLLISIFLDLAQVYSSTIDNYVSLLSFKFFITSIYLILIATFLYKSIFEKW